MSIVDTLLPKVKANLILEHGADDDLLRGLIRAAVSYAESYQHLPAGTYLDIATEGNWVKRYASQRPPNRP